MSLVFGWYSFKIKSFKSHELGIENDEFVNVSFEVRQKIFHFFWIPFFGIGKTYSLKRGDQHYELPYEIKSLIKAKGKIRTPWYSYTGLLLIPLGFIIYLGDGFMQDYKHRRSNERFISNKIEMIENPIINDFYKLSSKELYETCVIQVNDHTKDSILLKIPTDSTDEYLGSAYTMDSYFNELGDNYRLQWVSKEVLKSAIEDDPEDLYGFEGVSIPEILGDIKFDIDRIERMPTNANNE